MADAEAEADAEAQAEAEAEAEEESEAQAQATCLSLLFPPRLEGYSISVSKDIGEKSEKERKAE